MTISSAIGLLAAIIGSTATLLGAWAYFRSQHPPKRELFRVALTITIIMICILGLAVFISRATSIKINGQDNLPVPTVPGPSFPNQGQPSSSPTATPSPSPTAAPSPTSTPTLLASPSPTLTSSPVPSPSPTQKPKKR